MSQTNCSLVNKDTNKLQLNVYKLKIGFRIDKVSLHVNNNNLRTCIHYNNNNICLFTQAETYNLEVLKICPCRGILYRGRILEHSLR